MVVMLAFSMVFIGTASPVQAATAKSGKVAVTVPKTTLYVGDSKNNSTPITVTYNNKKVTSGVKYSTSNKKIATVKNGKIVASKKGTATISVKYKNKTCRFKITVKNATLNLSQTRAARKACGKPLFIKLSPNVSDIVAIARACEDAGADGLVLINTLLGMRIDIRKRKPVIANKMGGFSGRAVFPLALRMVYQVSRACRIPVMGCGGVAGAEDVIEMMMAGASAVQVGAENLRNPFACKEIVGQLPSLMEELGIESLNEIIGIRE